MKTRSTIQILFTAILFTAGALSTAYSQEPLPPDKKRALHRFDPADIFPEERESTRGAGRRRQRREGPAASAAPKNPAPSSNRLRSLTPAPTPRVSAAKAKPSPAPTLAPTPQVEATATSTPELAATPQIEATPQFDAVAAVQSSGISPQVPGGDQVGDGDGFPLYFLLPMLGLIVFVLIALIISLKKQLRTP